MTREFLFVGGYTLLCIILGFAGRNRKWGGWAYFFASMLLTPIIGLLLVLASDARKRLPGLTGDRP